MLYGPTAVERAMRRQEVIMRVFSGELSWLQAADILRMSPRSLRRWRRRYERIGYDGLLDRRTGRPSPRRAPVQEVETVVRLYRETYHGFNVRHYHGILRREHKVRLSYSFVKRALQEAGLVAKRKARGRHRRRREPRACFGELLHLDGSPHPWLALCPGARQTLIAVVDDATKRVLYAQLWRAETTEAVLTALREVIRTEGLPMALYTDRAGWAAHTPQAGGPVDKGRLTQVGRALKRLGVEHILAYSPQARGRSERMNGTFQGRLVNELRVAGIATREAANVYLTEHFVPQLNAEFQRAPADPASAFVPLGATDLDQILCHEEERTVGPDNVVQLEGVTLQIAKQPGRATCARLHVVVRRHLDATHSVWRGPLRLGTYDARGQPLSVPARPRVGRSNSSRPTGSLRSSAPSAHTGKRTVHLSN
jgi:transposase